MPRAADVIVAIAVGSAAGGVARYLLSDALTLRSSATFPVGTLVVNVAGCFAAGFLMRLVLETGAFTPTTRALLITGFCGGFTTFSTFAWESVAALEEGALRRTAVYTAASIGCGFAAVWIGAAMAQMLLTALRARAV